MPLGIGNNLIRNGGVLNPDGLSLDLQFAADKTFSKPSSLAAGETAITSRRGPSATFLRSTAATEVGPDGLIRYAPENLLTKSEEFNDAAWSRAAVGVAAATITPNSDIAPDGTTTADTANFSATTATNQQGMLFRNALTATIGQVVTFSVYMRVPSGTATVFIGLSEGIPLSGQSVACNVTTTWQRFSITRTAVAATQIYPEIGPDTRSFVGQPAVQPATSVFLWGAQVERHTSARAYIPTTTAVVYGPRFDHDPVTLACKGLLIEEGRTNLLTRSSNFPAGSWSINAGRLTWALDAIGPDGALSATTLTATGLSGGAFINSAGQMTAGVTYTHSAIVKAGSSNFAGISSFDGSNNYGAMFNLATGTFVGYRTDGAGGTHLANSITSLGGGWYRVSFTYTAANTYTGFSAQITISQAGNLNFGTPCTAGTSIIAFAYQMEAGSFPTSYIPTTTGTLARSADVCSITGGDFSGFYNPVEGVLFATASTFSPSSIIRRIVFATDGTGSNRAGLLFNQGSPPTFIASSGGNISALISTTVFPVTSPVEIAGAYKVDDFAISANGSTVTNDTSGLVGVGINRLDIGSQNNTDPLNGHIAALRYYKKRLPDAKLQALTV